MDKSLLFSSKEMVITIVGLIILLSIIMPDLFPNKNKILFSITNFFSRG